jgi:hypothetical protein
VSAQDSEVSDNIVVGGVQGTGSVKILNNNITGRGDIFNAIVVVYIGGIGSPVFSGNTLDGGAQALGKGPNVGIEYSGYITITNNEIRDCGPAIRGSITGSVQRNYFHDNQGTIQASDGLTIENNTFADSGPYVEGSPTVHYNNFLDNAGVTMATSKSLDATNNWWGTTDSAAIDQKIHDSKDDFNLGTVGYTPFLTAQNPQAMPVNNQPIPTSSPTEHPTQSPEPTRHPSPSQQLPTPTQLAQPTRSQGGTNTLFGLDWRDVAVVFLLVVIVVLVAVVAILLRRR